MRTKISLSAWLVVAAALVFLTSTAASAYPICNSVCPGAPCNTKCIEFPGALPTECGTVCPCGHWFSSADDTLTIDAAEPVAMEQEVEESSLEPVETNEATDSATVQETTKH